MVLRYVCPDLRLLVLRFIPCLHSPPSILPVLQLIPLRIYALWCLPFSRCCCSPYHRCSTPITLPCYLDYCFHDALPNHIPLHILYSPYLTLPVWLLPGCAVTRCLPHTALHIYPHTALPCVAYHHSAPRFRATVCLSFAYPLLPIAALRYLYRV